MKNYLFLDDIRIPMDAIAFTKNKGVDPTIYQEDWIIVRDFTRI